MLLVNYSDQAGGAGRAAFRLLQGLRAVGVHARMLVRERTTAGAGVVGASGAIDDAVGGAAMVLDRALLRLAPRRTTNLFTPAWAPNGVPRRILRLAPEVVHLHWIGGGTLRIESLAGLERPIIWTLHDMWPFTGGCHYDGGCARYVESCGHCPLLGSSSPRDLSSWIMHRKRRAWRRLELTLVAPSRWLAERAQASSLFRGRTVVVIPNGIDLALFRPLDAEHARSLLGLPLDRRYVLFGAADPMGEKRKGFHVLQAALSSLAARGWRDRVELLVLGGGDREGPANLGLPARSLGALRDEQRVALAIAAADVVAVPSLQDNLPNVAVEAAACGRPCVGFAVGGLPEIIEHGQSGWLARPFEAGELGAGIAWVLEDSERRRRLGARARHVAEQRFDLSAVARRYAGLYAELVELRPRRRV